VSKTARTLALLLLLTGCSGGGSSSTGSTTTVGAAGAQTATVEMRDDLKFHPTKVLARVGSVTLHVSNTGQVPHDLVFDDSSLGRTKTVDGKAATDLTVRFAKPGSFRFVCTFHSRMTGEVVVS